MTPADAAASVRARLARLARERNVELQLLLAEFAVERLLYRLGHSRFGDRYVLKGAMLFRLWLPVRGRATWDLDLLGHGADGVEDVAAVIREICAVPAEDGIELDPASVRAEEIRPDEKYGGVRVRLVARLAGARIPMQVDVGFGDAVTPAAERKTYPTLLDHPAPEILVYPRESVVAEKLEAMVSLGVTNSRMKDFFDLQVLAASFAFDGRTLAEAIVATFARRGTPLPDETPLALTPRLPRRPEPRDPVARLPPPRPSRCAPGRGRSGFRAASLPGPRARSALRATPVRVTLARRRPLGRDV